MAENGLLSELSGQKVWERQVVPLPSSVEWEARESLRGGVNVRKNLNFYLLLLIVSHYLATRQVDFIYSIDKATAKNLTMQNFCGNNSQMGDN
jgi:hypothetical protein